MQGVHDRCAASVEPSQVTRSSTCERNYHAGLRSHELSSSRRRLEGGALVVEDRHFDEALHEIVVGGGDVTRSLLGARQGVALEEARRSVCSEKTCHFPAGVFCRM